MLTPVFENIPAELRALPRWVCFNEKKIPFEPSSRRRPASILEPASWGSFEKAKTAFQNKGYSGVGFVLTGDGIAGVDLDHCVDNGKPQANALALLRRVGCQYIEFSPSGNGLRGFGFAPAAAGVCGIVDGTTTELYTNARYLTVTGHVIDGGPLVTLDGFAVVAAQIVGQRIRADVSPIASVSSVSSASFVSSVTSVSSVGDLVFPVWCLPLEKGQRNKAVFQLARYLKGVMPEADREQLHTEVTRWFDQVRPVIGTQDFAITWSDFITAWNKVKQPHGEALASALANLPDIPMSALPSGYGASGQYLMQICVALHQHHEPKPFFLSARICGELLGVHFTDASKILSAFVHEGLLSLITKGAGKSASRYRIGPCFHWASIPPQ